MSESYGIPVGDLKKKLPALLKRVEDLHEFNPMLGFRGCRLGIVHPEITEMQARAIFEAAVQVAKKGIKVIPEVMIPLVGFERELAMQKEIVERVAKEVLEKAGMKNMKYLIGTMIEIPRGALTADRIAEVAQFFSFGTNDLTQTTLGMSRDDYTKFSKKYEELKIFKADPFQTIDQEGVGKLIEQAVKLGRNYKSRIWKSESAASTAAIPAQWSSVIAWGWTMFRVRPIGYRSRGSRRRKRPLPAATKRKRCGPRNQLPAVTAHRRGSVLIRRFLPRPVKRGRLLLRLAIVRACVGSLLFFRSLFLFLVAEQRFLVLLLFFS